METPSLRSATRQSTKRKKKMVGNENRSFILLHSFGWFSISKMDGIVQKQTKRNEIKTKPIKNNEKYSIFLCFTFCEKVYRLELHLI